MDDWWSSVRANTQSNVPPKQAQTHNLALFLLAASPLGPRIVPLCCPRVVVDKVHPAIVLTFLCRHKENVKKTDVSIIGQGSEGSPESVVLRKTKQKCHNRERKPASLCGISLLPELIPRWGQIFVCVTTVMWWNSHNMLVRYFSYKENTYFYKRVYSCVCSCVGSSPLVAWTVRWCPILLPPSLRHLFLINRSVRRAQKQ